METTNPKIERNCVGGGRVDMDIDEWEIRPGGMLVQKRNPDSNQISASIPTIEVRVKHDSVYHQVCISSQASFGELKKMLAERTGLHPQDQKLVYRKKERDSKAYLDGARVKNGSKIVLLEDIASRERRCLEMLKNARNEKALKSLAEMSLEVDNFADQVTDLQAAASKGEKVLDIDLENLIGKFMTELVKLDEISVEGDLKLQKRVQERRVQKHIGSLDMLKLCNSKLASNGGNIKQEHSIEKQQQQQEGQSKQRDLTGKRPNLQHPSRHYDKSVVYTTKWETFD